MNAFRKIISILQICFLTTFCVDGKPCSNSSSECQNVRMPLVSNKLNAPLVAELDVTEINKQLATFIIDDIKSTFSKDIRGLVKKEQDDIKISMLQDYSSKLNKTKKEYDKHISEIVQSLEEKQNELQLGISDVHKNLSERESTFNKEITDMLSRFEQRQERLKLAMISEYTSKLRQLENNNNKTINELASNQNSQFDNLSREFKKEVMKSTTNLPSQMEELVDWKTNLMESLKGAFAAIRYKDCSYMKGQQRESGVYIIYPEYTNGIKAFCDMSTDGGGWTVIQRRIDGTTSFERNWDEYKEGFGDPQKEYWLGNKYLNMLTTNGKYELRVELTDTNNKMAFAMYKTFTVSDENSKYKLTIGGHSGTASDLMAYNNDMKFSTKDRDHDTNSSGSCTETNGGWWYDYCSSVALNRDMTKYKLYWGRNKYIKSSMMIRQIM